MFTKIKNWIRSELSDYSVLLRSVPSTVVSLFVVSVVMMNLLANKTLLQLDWIALDGGLLVSWLAFMSMDVITKHFGPKASTKVSIFASGINILVCFIYWIASIIPSTADDYTAFNSIIGGTWFILLGSTIAFILSALINNSINWGIGTLFKKNPSGKVAYFTRTYVSTALGQFCDNLIFAVIVFMGFAPIYWDGFRWTFIQCMMCSLTGAVVELFFQVVFSPLAWNVSQNWKKASVGAEYLNKHPEVVE